MRSMSWYFLRYLPASIRATLSFIFLDFFLCEQMDLCSFCAQNRNLGKILKQKYLKFRFCQKAPYKWTQIHGTSKLFHLEPHSVGLVTFSYYIKIICTISPLAWSTIMLCTNFLIRCFEMKHWIRTCITITFQIYFLSSK